MTIKNTNPLLRWNEMKAGGFCPFSKSHTYALMAEGKFPKPRKIGTQAVAWLLSDLIKWQEKTLLDQVID